MDEVDPEGLMPMDGPGSSPEGSPGYADGAASGFGGSMEEFGMEWHQYFTGGPALYRYEYPGGEYDIFPTYWAPVLFDGVGGAFGVGLSAVGSAATFHVWNGGAARHDPSFGTSLALADVGVAAGTAAFGGEAAEGARPATNAIEDIFRNPSQLAGKGLEEIKALLGKIEDPWEEGVLTKGSQKGNGWTLREGNGNGNYTDRYLQWHPGGGHHGPDPYWKISSGRIGTLRL